MRIPVIKTVREMQSRCERLRLGGHRIALVPTMGALHAGHLALIREARKHADTVLASIFVNPTQFGEGEDLNRYPRRLSQDVEALADVGGVDAVFAPDVGEMYPTGAETNGDTTWVEVTGLDAHLCGRYRPDHFRGVTTVVAKLFHACKPHTAVFGLKDAQQFVIIRRMVRDLLMDIDVVGVPTVRAEDGLALSSRNEYLSPEQRQQALVIPQAVFQASEQIGLGEQQIGPIVESIRKKLAESPLARVQYAEVVDADSLQPVARLEPGMEALVAVAAYFGDTRLIDSAFVRVP